MIPDLRLPWVHVQDVADAHIAAMTSEAADGTRTLLTTDPLSLVDVAKVLREPLPEPNQEIPDGRCGRG
jgi:dihydroflavonol-4-reductase